MANVLEAPRPAAASGRPAVAETVVPPPKPYNATLRAQVLQKKNQIGLSGKELATQIGVSETEVSKYLNGKPAGDVEKTERLLVSWLTNLDRKRRAPHVAGRLIVTSVVEEIRTALDTIKETNDFGVIVGPAGLGKTRGIQDYVVHEDATAISIVISDDNRSRAGVIRLICDQEGRNKPRRIKDDKEKGRGKLVWEYPNDISFLRAQLKGSYRLLIVDNAHKLADSGLDALFDFHDATGIPVVLLGNPSIIAKIMGRKEAQKVANEQRTSRVGFFYELEPGHRDDKDYFTDAQVREFIRLHLDSFSEKFFRKACKIANGTGYFRSLHKHLLLAKRLLSAGERNDVAALTQANGMLLTDVELAEED